MKVDFTGPFADLRSVIPEIACSQGGFSCVKGVFGWIGIPVHKNHLPACGKGVDLRGPLRPAVKFVSEAVFSRQKIPGEVEPEDKQRKERGKRERFQPFVPALVFFKVPEPQEQQRNEGCGCPVGFHPVVKGHEAQQQEHPPEGPPEAALPVVAQAVSGGSPKQR